MKRFHVHLHVRDLARSMAFYERLFGAAPARVEADYAKWMLDDPPVNFALSTRGEPGLNHFGLQTDEAADLEGWRARAEQADLAVLDAGETTCCYARSDKHWVRDPEGLPWEFFQTLSSIPVFREAADDVQAQQRAVAGEGACCVPQAAAAGPVVAATAAAAPSCCAPARRSAQMPAHTLGQTPAQTHAQTHAQTPAALAAAQPAPAAAACCGPSANAPRGCC